MFFLLLFPPLSFCSFFLFSFFSPLWAPSESEATRLGILREEVERRDNRRCVSCSSVAPGSLNTNEKSPESVIGRETGGEASLSVRETLLLPPPPLHTHSPSVISPSLLKRPFGRRWQRSIVFLGELLYFRRKWTWAGLGRVSGWPGGLSTSIPHILLLSLTKRDVWLLRRKGCCGLVTFSFCVRDFFCRCC